MNVDAKITISCLELRRLQIERDLYRARAIDEVADHHKGASRLEATFDVDQEVQRHIQGGRYV